MAIKLKKMMRKATDGGSNDGKWLVKKNKIRVEAAGWRVRL